MSEENDAVLDQMFDGQEDNTQDSTEDLEIVAIVDRSGSMGSIKNDAEGGLNSFFDSQRDIPGNVTVTLVQFDIIVETCYTSRALEKVEPYVLDPRGTTALLDAIGIGLTQHESVNNNVLVVIVTDGGENASREYTNDAIKKLIAEKEEAGWEFLFLAANQDAIQSGGNLGIGAANAFNFAASGDGVAEAYTTASIYASSLRTKGKLGAQADLVARKVELGQD